jgi:hypothetical protein
MSMRRVTTAATLVALAAVTGVAEAQDESRAAADGGIHVDGWMGKIDAREAENGQALENASLTMDGGSLHVVTGPAVTYWNPDNTASGDYTVSATFTEPAYMALNNHPHPYGLVIAGNGLGTDQQSYLYCAAYGNGSFIVRGFGPDAFQMNGRRAQEHEAVHKASAAGEPVTQEIALSVRGDMVECAINGTTVASYPKADVVTDGKLSSTDGVYGIRFGHNTEATVAGLELTQR